MARAVKTALHSTGGVRVTLYLPKVLTQDSRFPLDLKRPVLVRIRGKKLVVEQDTSKATAVAVAEKRAATSSKKSKRKR